MRENETVSCSNAHRHLAKVCWMNRKIKKDVPKKEIMMKAKIPIDSFFKGNKELPQSTPSSFVTTCK